MKIYQSLTQIPQDIKGQVLVIGNFDGLHRGHKVLIDQAKNIAAINGRKCIILTFEPHPRKLFRPDDPPFRITPYRLKMKKLEDMGIDAVISLEFNWDFASQDAQHFIDKVLLNSLDAGHVIVGCDFRFGQLRKGNPEMIQKSGILTTQVSHESGQDGKKYSSSVIRQLLREGDIIAANEDLGWDWEIQGEVLKGDQRGRKLGYPTANVSLNDVIHPAYGIYACLVQIIGENKWHPSAANIGIRPMFELQFGQMEAHILGGFDRDIYGKILRVKLVKKLRGEAKFENLDALCIQIEKDCQESLAILSRHKRI